MSVRSPGRRLFWKFLIFFFLAQMTTVLVIGLAIWIIKPDLPGWPPPPPPLRTERDLVTRPSFPPSMQLGEPTGPGAPPPFRDDPKPALVHLLAGAVASLIFAALLAAYVSRPVRRLRLALQAGASGQLTANLSAAMGNRRDELADLGQDFDRMAKHLAHLMEGQRRLLHDVSHELRSPLARLNAIIGLARQRPERIDDLLAMLENESAKMDCLLSELLTLSRLESGMVRRADEVIDLPELLRDVIADAKPEAELADFRMELRGAEDVQISGDPEMLHRVFDNLLRNALIHAAVGKCVELNIVVNNDEVVVRVEDCGPGVSTADVANLFVPFYRGAQTLGKNGHGLGLAIAKQIVENHGGKIRVANRPEGGLSLKVSLPRVSKSAKDAKGPD